MLATVTPRKLEPAPELPPNEAVLLEKREARLLAISIEDTVEDPKVKEKLFRLRRAALVMIHELRMKPGLMQTEPELQGQVDAIIEQFEISLGNSGVVQ